MDVKELQPLLFASLAFIVALVLAIRQVGFDSKCAVSRLLKGCFGGFVTGGIVSTLVVPLGMLGWAGLLILCNTVLGGIAFMYCKNNVSAAALLIGHVIVQGVCVVFAFGSR